MRTRAFAVFMAVALLAASPALAADEKLQPSEATVTRAQAGTLHRPRVLLAEMRRMLRDDRVRGFVTEFGGHWLDFRRFEEHNAVDRSRFKTFNNELRAAMFEEPIRFFMDVVRRPSAHQNLASQRVPLLSILKSAW